MSAVASSSVASGRPLQPVLGTLRASAYAPTFNLDPAEEIFSGVGYNHTAKGDTERLQQLLEWEGDMLLYWQTRKYPYGKMIIRETLNVLLWFFLRKEYVLYSDELLYFEGAAHLRLHQEPHQAVCPVGASKDTLAWLARLCASLLYHVPEFHFKVLVDDAVTVSRFHQHVLELLLKHYSPLPADLHLYAAKEILLCPDEPAAQGSLLNIDLCVDHERDQKPYTFLFCATGRPMPVPPQTHAVILKRC